MMCFSNPSPQQ